MAETHTLSNLPRIVRRPKKRLGRGHGSGKVKTAGRGTKGQKARGRIKAGFEGGQLPIIKRLPLLRGKGKNQAAAKAFPISLDSLNMLPKNSDVTLETLRKFGMVGREVTRVKILGNGSLNTPLTVRVPVSASARTAIEKAGGTVIA